MAARARYVAQLALALLLTSSAALPARAQHLDWPASAFVKPEPDPAARKSRRPPPDPSRLVKSPKKIRPALTDVARSRDAVDDRRTDESRQAGRGIAGQTRTDAAPAQISPSPAAPMATSSTSPATPPPSVTAATDAPARMSLGMPPSVEAARPAPTSGEPLVQPSWLPQQAAPQASPSPTQLAASRSPDTEAAPTSRATAAATPPPAVAPPAPSPTRTAVAPPAVPPKSAPSVPSVPSPPPASTLEAEARAAAVARGQRLWTLRRGPRHASLDECDLGLGAGRVVGTFAHLPRYFADAQRVMDLETRIAWCARTHQDVPLDALHKSRAVDGVMATEMEDLAIYVASLSASWRLSPPAAHAKEQVTYEVGKALYARRQGPLDFSCATCHGSAPRDGAAAPAAPAQNATAQSIGIWKGRPVPQLATPADSQAAIGNWPAWSPELGGVQTLQGRLATCFWHMGVEPPLAGSDAMVALVTYLTRQAEKGEVLAPGRRR